MKKVNGFIISLVAFLLIACTQSQATQSKEREVINSKVIFINASQNRDGNTVKMSKQLLDGIDYTQINLVDYQINQLGQSNDNDQFEEVLGAMENAETIVIGTPVYWHSMSGSLKTLIDRFYELQNSSHSLEGKNFTSLCKELLLRNLQ